MTAEFTIVPGITAEIWTAPEEGSATGLILNPGKELTDDELDAVAAASDTNARVWEAIGDTGGLFAHASSVNTHVPSGFKFSRHLPHIPNVLPHSDNERFMLYADQPRWGQDTVISPRTRAVKVLMDVTEKFLEKKAPEALKWFRRYKAQLGCHVSHDYTCFFEDNGRDVVVILFLNMHKKLFKLGLLTDENLFELSCLMDRELDQFSFRCIWNQSTVLFVTREAFHYRYCEASDLINEGARGLWTSAQIL